MEKAVVYSKQWGQSCVPLTVRIEWLPDGTINPLMFWTPDRTCYQVTHIYECVALAYLKDRGEGLRLKVRAEVFETPEPEFDLHFIQFDTYLYLADNRFCGQNIVDGRYGHAGKVYVPVTMDVFPNGDYELAFFSFHGERYQIEKTINIEPRGAFRAGGVGLWHKVEARLINTDDEYPDSLNSTRRVAALYLEFDKWFVSVNC